MVTLSSMSKQDIIAVLTYDTLIKPICIKRFAVLHIAIIHVFYENDYQLVDAIKVLCGRKCDHGTGDNGIIKDNSGDEWICKPYLKHKNIFQTKMLKNKRLYMYFAILKLSQITIYSIF